MTYPETIHFLESFIDYEKIPVYPYKESLKLERIKEYLATIGNPQDSLRCIHVAGTKGKGSTCAFLAYILRQAGFKTGLYTSPHLSDFRERIRVLTPRSPLRAPRLEFEGMITKEALTGLVEKLKPAIEKYNQASKYGPLSFFEVYTSLSFVYFKEKKVDFAVLETGLGGRLDATNVADSLVCAITPISYEHTQKLGNTLKEIAQEKAGIIKRSIVITAPQKKETLLVIKNKCNDTGAKLYRIGKDIRYQKIKEVFKVEGLFGEYPNLKIRLIGEHQLINASVAVGVIEALRFYNINISVDSVKKGLYDSLWPARCEVVSKNPLVILDGAQNIASAQALKKAIKKNSAFRGKYKKLILVLGISQDKDIKGICNELCDLADTVILTKANNPRATNPQELAGYFKRKLIYITQSVKEAKNLSCEIAKKEDAILVTGSLFVVGEFRDVKS